MVLLASRHGPGVRDPTLQLAFPVEESEQARKQIFLQALSVSKMVLISQLSDAPQVKTGPQRKKDEDVGVLGFLPRLMLYLTLEARAANGSAKA